MLHMSGSSVERRVYGRGNGEQRNRHRGGRRQRPMCVRDSLVTYAAIDTSNHQQLQIWSSDGKQQNVLSLLQG